MNNKVIGGIVVVVIIAAIAWWAMGNKTNAPESNQNTNQTESATDKTDAANTESVLENKSLVELMAMGSKKCESTQESEAWTFYIGNNKSRGDFSTPLDNGAAKNGHMIFDGDTAYMWTDGEQIAVKMNTKEMGANQTNNQSVDPNAKMNYSCSAWTPDASMFVPPANVQFMDMNALMKR